MCADIKVIVSVLLRLRMINAELKVEEVPTNYYILSEYFS